MDRTLRELERQGLDDPLILQRYNVHLCRLKGHQFTISHSFEDYLSNDSISVRVCWRCHQPQVGGSQAHEKLVIPELVLWSSEHLWDSPVHALVSFTVKRKTIKKARKKRRKSAPPIDESVLPPQPSSVRITIKAKTACGQDIKSIHDPQYILKGTHGNKSNGKGIKELNCRRCVKTSKLVLARSKAAEIYKEVWEAARDRVRARADCNNSSSDYLPDFETRH